MSRDQEQDDDVTRLTFSHEVTFVIGHLVPYLNAIITNRRLNGITRINAAKLLVAIDRLPNPTPGLQLELSFEWSYQPTIRCYLGVEFTESYINAYMIESFDIGDHDTTTEFSTRVLPENKGAQNNKLPNFDGGSMCYS